MSGLTVFVRRGRHLPNFLQREGMWNIIPDALSLRHLSILAQGWRKFVYEGADQLGIDVFELTMEIVDCG